MAQRLYGLALGHEELNDHAFLRRDSLLATACDKPDPCGQDRAHPAPRGAALAAPCTLNCWELSNNKTTRGHKLPHDPAAVADSLLSLGSRCLPKHAPEVVLDLDAMGHLLHGLQEGRHFSTCQRDRLLRVFVDVADNAENRQFFVEFKERLKTRFQQLEIWLTTHPIEVI